MYKIDSHRRSKSQVAQPHNSQQTQHVRALPSPPVGGSHSGNGSSDGKEEHWFSRCEGDLFRCIGRTFCGLYRADIKSITRGQSRRLQPSNPCTKAQAAVALTCGRVTEFKKAEITRLEAEKVSRESELRELRSEILERGDIKQYWERKMEEERNHGMEADMDYRSAVVALEHEKALQESGSAELIKQKAALECQEQLLSSLKAEVTEMSETLSLEKALYIDELRGTQDMRHALQAKYEELLDAKSILEAEIEALRILLNVMNMLFITLDYLHVMELYTTFIFIVNVLDMSLITTFGCLDVMKFDSSVLLVYGIVYDIYVVMVFM